MEEENSIIMKEAYTKEIGKTIRCMDMEHFMIRMETLCMKGNGTKTNFTESAKYTIKRKISYYKNTIMKIWIILNNSGQFMKDNYNQI